MVLFKDCLRCRLGDFANVGLWTMLFSVEYDVDYALMVVKQTLETENI